MVMEKNIDSLRRISICRMNGQERAWSSSGERWDETIAQLHYDVKTRIFSIMTGVDCVAVLMPTAF